MYPNTKQSPQEISKHLLDICEKGGRPLVMGTRMTEQEQKHAAMKWMFQLWLNVIRVFLAKTLALLQGIASPLLSMGGAVNPPGDHLHQE